MTPATADLYDAYADELQVVTPGLRHFGGVHAFCGPMTTLKVHEDNGLVGDALRSPGEGRVLVVDGGGSLRRALLGDQLAQAAAGNGWKGVVIHGCLRDTVIVHKMLLGVLALASCPAKTVKRHEGEVDVPLSFLGAEFRPGEWLYADEDGLLLAPRELSLEA